MKEKVKKFIKDNSTVIETVLVIGTFNVVIFCLGYKLSYKKCVRYKQQFLSWLLEHPEGFKLKNSEIPGSFLLTLTKVA